MNTTTRYLIYFHIIEFGEDNVYTDHTTISDKIEKLFSIDPQISTDISMPNTKYKDI